MWIRFSIRYDVTYIIFGRFPNPWAFFFNWSQQSPQLKNNQQQKAHSQKQFVLCASFHNHTTVLSYCWWRPEILRAPVELCSLSHYLQLAGGFTYFFIFTPTWGDDPIWLILWKGWKPPTRQGLIDLRWFSRWILAIPQATQHWLGRDLHTPSWQLNQLGVPILVHKRTTNMGSWIFLGWVVEGVCTTKLHMDYFISHEIWIPL